MASDGSNAKLALLCLSLPLNIEREELIVLSKQGSIFDDTVVRDSLVMAFNTSMRVTGDAVTKVQKALETYSARKVNILTYE